MTLDGLEKVEYVCKHDIIPTAPKSVGKDSVKVAASHPRPVVSQSKQRNGGVSVD